MPQLSAALPFIGLGLGVYQTIRSENQMNRAIEEARRPRLSTEQQATIRKEGTSNINASLASRGLLDSSLYPGALIGLEKGIAETTAGAGTVGDVPGLLARQATGEAQSGSGLIGSVAEMYLLRRLLGETGQPQAGPSQPTQPARPSLQSPFFAGVDPYQQFYYPQVA